MTCTLKQRTIAILFSNISVDEKYFGKGVPIVCQRSKIVISILFSSVNKLIHYVGMSLFLYVANT